LGSVESRRADGEKGPCSSSSRDRSGQKRKKLRVAWGEGGVSANNGRHGDGEQEAGEVVGPHAQESGPRSRGKKEEKGKKLKKKLVSGNCKTVLELVQTRQAIGGNFRLGLSLVFRWRNRRRAGTGMNHPAKKTEDSGGGIKIKISDIF